MCARGDDAVIELTERFDRLKLTQENTKNHLKRRRIMLESWDEVFHMLHACTKRCAPLLHQTMYEACDMRN